MKNPLLSKEIVSHILALLGTGTQLFSLQSCKIAEIDMEYEEGQEVIKFKHPIYGGLTELNNFKLTAIVVDLTFNGVKEYIAVVIPGEGQQVYLLHKDRLLVKNKIWVDANMQQQASLLIAFERLNDLGAYWIKLNENKYLSLIMDYIESL